MKYTMQSVNISILCVSGTFFVSYVFTRQRLTFTCIMYNISVRTAQ